MDITRYTPAPVPFEAAPNLRAWLDEQVRRLAVLVNNSVQLEEVPELSINDDQLSSNVALLNRDPQTFSGKIKFTGHSGNLFGDGGVIIETQVPNVIFTETDQAAGGRSWSWGVGTRNFRLMSLGDDLSAGVAAISVVRAVGSNTISSIGFDSTQMGFYGKTPVNRPSGVAVTAAGIHAALVNLGLITA